MSASRENDWLNEMKLIWEQGMIDRVIAFYLVAVAISQILLAMVEFGNRNKSRHAWHFLTWTQRKAMTDPKA